MKKLSFLAILLSGMVFGQNIAFKANKLYPEGMAYSVKKHSFLVSSTHFGQIGEVDAKGNYKVLVNEKSLISSLGIQVDNKKNILYVAVGDLNVSEKSSQETQGKTAKLVAYDLTSGKQKWVADLGKLTENKTNLANDLAIDADGNTYVTDSFMPNVYKVDGKGKASIFAQNEAWKVGDFGLNGIVVHPKGFLLVNLNKTGDLFSISIKNPKDIKKVNVPLIVGADGMVLNPKNKNEMMVMSFSQNKIFLLETTDNWVSAKIKDTQESVLPNPTTGVCVDGTYYVLNSKLSEAFDVNSSKTNADYLIQKVVFKK